MIVVRLPDLRTLRRNSYRISISKGLIDLNSANGKRDRTSTLKQAKDIEKEFFDFDQDEPVVHLQMEFQNPGEIFDQSIKTNVPRMNDDFIDRVIGMFELIPQKYKLDFRIVFDDLEEYDEDQLAEISKKNILLAKEIMEQRVRRDNSLAISLCVTGLLFMLVSIYAGRFWTDGGAAGEIVSFILDILATVPFWGAMEVFLIDNRRRRRTTADLAKRFCAITFYKKQN